MQRRNALIIALLIAAPPVQAQVLDTATRRIDLAGTAPAACVIAQPTASQTVNASYAATGTTSGQITIAQLVDSQNATSLESAIRLDLPVTCNSSHRVTVRSANGALVRTGAAAATTALLPGGFAEAVNYQLGVNWAGATRSFGSDARQTAIDTPQPAKGELTLNFSTAAGSGPLVAGQYTDSIVVELIPAN
ncbi:MAG: hypothetical protein RIQ99_1996 [Pseudomonadota bacterium]|jgi:hypothetical protein